VDLETVEARISSVDGEAAVEHRFSATILLDLIHRLKSLDRQVIMLYLDGEAAGSIAEVTGITANDINTAEFGSPHWTTFELWLLYRSVSNWRRATPTCL
jgi:DNA-directed RNA polymerase specialized sigma24 family protein